MITLVRRERSSLASLLRAAEIGVPCLFLACGACANSPVTQPGPTPTAPTVTGVWVGTYFVSSCSGLEGVLRCDPTFMPTKPGSMRLDLTQVGDAVKGTFTSDLVLRATVPVSGSIDTSRTLRLTGGQVAIVDCFGPGGQVGVDIGDWITALDGTGRWLTGTFRQSRTYLIISCYPSFYHLQSRIIILARAIESP